MNGCWKKGNLFMSPESLDELLINKYVTYVQNCRKNGFDSLDYDSYVLKIIDRGSSDVLSRIKRKKTYQDKKGESN